MRSIKSRVRGLTLVELMVSMALSLLIMLALLTILINVNRSNLELSGSNRVIENGRFAMQLLQADVAHAGYWGGHIPQFDDLTLAAGTTPGDTPTAVPDPCLAYNATNWTTAYTNNLFGIAVQGTDVPSPVPAPTTPICSSVVTNPYPNTDVLVVRNAEPCLVGSGTGDCSDTRAEASPHLYLQVSRCGHDAARYAFGTSTFTLHAGDCVAGTPVTGSAGPIRRVSSSIYYVRDFANTAGDGIPTLMRARLGVGGSGTASAGNVPAFTSAQALVEGVEGFRVEYGIDNLGDTAVTIDLAKLGEEIDWENTAVLKTPRNRGNGLPDTYIRCSQASPCTADQLVNVTTVKLYVLVRAENSSPGHTDTKKYCLASRCSVAADYLGPFNDRYKRHLFMQTIRLTNVAARRETP